MSEAVVTIRAIGALWMPQAPAAWAERYRVGMGPFEKDIRSLQDAEARLAMDSGDLSRVDDYEVTAEVTRRYTRPGVVGSIVHTRRVTWRAWEKPESEDTWCELTYGGGE